MRARRTSLARGAAARVGVGGKKLTVRNQYQDDTSQPPAANSRGAPSGGR